MFIRGQKSLVIACQMICSYTTDASVCCIHYAVCVCMTAWHQCNMSEVIEYGWKQCLCARLSSRWG